MFCLIHLERSGQCQLPVFFYLHPERWNHRILTKRNTVIGFTLIFKSFRIIPITEEIEEVTGRSDKGIQVETLPGIIKRERPLIHKALQIVIPNTMTEGERRLLESVHRIGKECSQTKADIRIIEAPRREVQFLILYLFVIISMNSRTVRYDFMDTGNLIQLFPVGIVSVNTNLMCLLHLIGVMSRTCNQINGDLALRLSLHLIFIIPVQTVQPDFCRFLSSIFLLKRRNRVFPRINTDQQTVTTETFKHDPVVPFRPGQDRRTLQFLIIAMRHIREAIAADKQFLFYSLRFSPLYLRRKS